MFIKDITALVNTHLAGEMLSYTDMRPFLDHTIDDINTMLNAKFPVFSDSSINYEAEYTAFNDKFIRSVVVPGAVWYYYVVDEEGAPTAQQLSADYSRGLFVMQRDMLYSVPAEYQADDLQGAVSLGYDLNQGVEVDNLLGEW